MGPTIARTTVAMLVRTSLFRRFTRTNVHGPVRLNCGQLAAKYPRNIRIFLQCEVRAYFTGGEVCGAVVLRSARRRSRDGFAVVGDAPAVAGRVVTLLVRVASVLGSTSRHVDVAASSSLLSRQASLLHTPAPARPLCNASAATAAHYFFRFFP